MLFDLRSKSRRRAVQVIYLGLAIVMGGGLVLFGVGTGNGNGGLLNSFTGGGSNSAQNQAITAQTKAAEKAVTKSPNDPASWASLVQAYYTAAGEGSNINSSTGVYNAPGKALLSKSVAAFSHYTTLAKSPATDISILAARAYEQLANWSGEATAWEYVTESEPNSILGYKCLAASAYAAKQTRKGDLATAKVLTLAPKVQQATYKTLLTEAKTSTTVAASC